MGSAERRRAISRLTAGAGALALAAVTAACSAGTDMAGAQPAAPTVAIGRTVGPAPTGSAGSGGSGTAPACNAQASSLAPTANAVDGADVQRIKNSGVLTVGVAADQYLTGYLGSDGEEEGFDIDLANAIGQALFGVPGKVRFVAISTADRIPDLQQHKVDLVVDTMTITCARLQQVAFSAVYYKASQRLLVTKGTPYTSIDQLGGQKVCAQSGSTSIALLQSLHASPGHPLPIPVQVTNVTDCLMLMQENQVAAISTDDTLLAGLADQDPNLAVVGSGLEPEPYGVAMPLQEPDLEEYVNGVLAQYEADGDWAKSYATWFRTSLGAAEPPPAQYSD
jgi:polar amino acid transport system substrate-binding protein